MLRIRIVCELTEDSDSLAIFLNLHKETHKLIVPEVWCSLMSAQSVSDSGFLNYFVPDYVPTMVLVTRYRNHYPRGLFINLSCLNRSHQYSCALHLIFSCIGFPSECCSVSPVFFPLYSNLAVLVFDDLAGWYLKSSENDCSSVLISEMGGASSLEIDWSITTSGVGEEEVKDEKLPTFSQSDSCT